MQEKFQENNGYFSFESGTLETLRLISRLPKPVIVLVAGGSCSGKGYFSSLLENLSAKSGISVSTVNMDGCFRDIDDPLLPHDGIIPIFDIPGSYHLDEIKECVLNLVRGKDIKYPEYDILKNKRKKGTFKLIKSSDVIIIDGLFAISELTDLVNYIGIIKVFIHADESVRMKRRIERDEKYGINKEVIKKVFTNRIAHLHWKYVEPQRLIADIVIVNN